MEAAPRCDDPLSTTEKHPLGRGVGLDGHDLVDQAVERFDAPALLAASEDPGPVHVPGGQAL